MNDASAFAVTVRTLDTAALPLAQALREALSRRQALVEDQPARLEVAVGTGSYEIAFHPLAPREVREGVAKLMDQFALRRRYLKVPSPRAIVVTLPQAAPFGPAFWERFAEILAPQRPLAVARPEPDPPPPAPAPPRVAPSGAASGWVMGGIRRPRDPSPAQVRGSPPPVNPRPRG